MICVIQRVTRASVVVDGQTVGSIGLGLCVLACVHTTDTDADVEWTAGKLASLRVFRQNDKHFDLDVAQVGGSVLLVSNFTVAADARKGRRPSFDQAARGEQGQALFDRLVEQVRAKGIGVETGQFGADMTVHIENDGPATFILDSRTKPT